MRTRIKMRFCFHARQVLIALDQVGNTLIGGYADETLSAHCYRSSQRTRCAAVARVLLDTLFRPWGRDHCRASYESEKERRQLPPEYRESDH